MAAKRKPVKPAKPVKPSRRPRPTRYTGLAGYEIEFLAEMRTQGRLRLTKGWHFRKPAPVSADNNPMPVSPVVDARSVDATVWDQNNFTVVRLAVVGADGKKHELVGVSKRNPGDDEYSRRRGRRIALARAARGEAVRQ